MKSMSYSLGIGFIALAATFVIGVYVSSVYERIVDSYEHRAADAANDLGLFLNGRLQALKILAEQPEIASLDPVIVRPRLVKLTENWGGRNAALFNARGELVTSVELPHPRLVNDRPSFLRALDGNLVISNRIARPGYDSPFTSLRVPVRNRYGVAEGVLTAGMPSRDFAAVMHRVADARFELLIVDGNRELLYHDNVASLRPYEGALRELAAAFPQRSRGYVYTGWPFENVKMLFISVPVSGTDWLMVAAVPATAVVGAVAAEALPGVAALLLAMLCAGLTVYFRMQARKYRSALAAQRMQQLAGMNQLAAGIVHEFHNPLAAVKGFVQLALAGADRLPDAKQMGGILDEIGRIEQLVNEFRVLARPQEQGQMAIVDLVPGVGKAVTLLGGMAAAKDAAVEYDPGCETLEIIGNAGMLEELWMSLIGNALGAVPAGGRVEVAVGRRQRCGVVSIRDNGAGIPAAGLDRLGTPFYTTKATGSGLGVSIAYNIVHRHRGTIEYCSEAGQGTTVSVTLPLA